MPTFITTRKMHPELRERIAASVRGRRKQTARRFGPRIVAVVRFTAVLLVLSSAVALVTARRRNHEELESARASLLASVRAKSEPLSPNDMEVVTRAEEWIVRLAGPYEGDAVATELSRDGALNETLTRPLVYVRGPISSMAHAQMIALAAAVSSKDPLVSCLVDPPKARTEKAMLTKVRSAYARDVLFERSTPNVTRLDDAEVGLPFLTPAWAARVSAAEELPDVLRLRRELEKAPTDGARRAAQSDLLFVAMDEEGDKKGVTELDGERPHKIRLTLVDLRAKKVLVRLQRSVDPAWISEAARPAYASGLDGCAMAIDVRDAVRPRVRESSRPEGR